MLQSRTHILISSDYHPQPGALVNDTELTHTNNSDDESDSTETGDLFAALDAPEDADESDETESANAVEASIDDASLVEAGNKGEEQIGPSPADLAPYALPFTPAL